LPAEYVLDSFAIVALTRREPGAERVRDLLRQAERGEATVRLSAMNAGEVAYLEERKAGFSSAQQLLARLRQSPVIVVDASWERILAAAHVKARFPLSFSDAFAVGLAQEFGAPILTGDPEFHSVENIVTIEWLSRR
jgi:predicted nucleic acid-binding protein